MNLRSALGPADPAKGLPPTTPDEDLLASILSMDSITLPERADGRRTRKPTRHDRRPLIVTAAVAVAVAAVAITAIQVAPTSTPAPASTAPSQAALENAVFARLTEVATGDIPVRNKSATTWSSTTRGADGGAIDLTGKTLYIAAACAGGGAIAIKVSGHNDRALDCGTLSTLGPIDLTAEIGPASQTADLDVVVLAGSPHYVAKSMAFPTTPTPPQTTGRTTACKPSDFQITAHLEGTVMNYTQSPVTLVQDAGHPCASPVPSSCTRSATPVEWQLLASHSRPSHDGDTRSPQARQAATSFRPAPPRPPNHRDPDERGGRSRELQPSRMATNQQHLRPTPRRRPPRQCRRSRCHPHCRPTLTRRSRAGVSQACS